MNKLEANISLLAITFFAAIQYVFLANIPADVSSFAFLAITNLIGFLFAAVFLFHELHRLDKRQILQSLILAGELFGFNLSLLIGSKNTDPTVVSCIITAYFIFVPILLMFKKQRVKKSSLFAIALVLCGVILVVNADMSKVSIFSVLFLLLSDVFFAGYIITVESFSAKSSPSILGMGQMLFGFVLAFIAWCIESAINGAPLSLPHSAPFWRSVIFISIFIRGLYGIVQIYAQRYVSALNTSLIFSTEVVITLLLSPLLANFLHMEASPITPVKLIGCIIIVVGVLSSDGTLQHLARRKK